MSHDDVLSERPITKVQLDPPTLTALLPAIRAGFSSNFKNSIIEITQSPDLRQPPYYLATPGLSGHPRIADVGGQLFLAPGPDFSKKYDLLSVARQMEMSTECGQLIGAAAGPFYSLQINTELAPNIHWKLDRDQATDVLYNETHYTKIIASEPGYRCSKIDHETTGFGLMGNLYGSDGLPGDLLHIVAKSRSGPLNFAATIQDALAKYFGDKLISLGGVFVVTHGKIKVHVMPDFPERKFERRADVGPWLRYFNLEAPLVCLSVLHSGNDRGLSLRMEHTHCFSINEDGHAVSGGHYHYDLDDTKDEVEYEGWFNIATVLYRIDQPPK
ncbi:uncharacterized protein Z518_10088 [Rhinocladiella mackenziei CBS 650.93]|uniref:DUF1907 domain-containing protein n=1 Tax=Rhinocladiella mackenziei CBS 650.93 TaxID=1442369 RepID=A0A0D2FGD0_9EURO|nr:uncharacterized protein Z518_10088 [Rhinocladiella mackenziei CBS 650.93]KIX01022.1 hypothetical protein Z518_10088 [Rhinocladiella mackenziei CBS 650.93]